MEIQVVREHQHEVAVIRSSEILIHDVQSALDVMATVGYETGCSRIVIDKTALCEDFFQLKTMLAGDILQKFMNYQVKLAVVGDFSAYASKSLKDFIYECNQGRAIFFLPSESQAIAKLGAVL